MPVLMATSVIQDALALLRDQSVPQAIDRLENAVVETPAYPAAYVLLARAYESQNDWGAARSAWDQAFVLIPHSPTVQEGRHRVRARIREQRRADETAAERAFSNSAPDTPRTAEPAPPASPAQESSDDADEQDLPSLPMDDGPSDLESLRAQTEQSTRQQHAASGLSAADLSSSADALDDLDDLDRLIEELRSARIQPDPSIDDLPAPNLDDDIEDMVSETLARIYASQGAHHEAARVYVQLAAQEPERSEEFLQEASRMRQKARAEEE